MNETFMTTHGNVVADPVRRHTAGGDPFVTFRIASTVRRRRQDSGEYYDAYTNFYDVVAFRQLAVNAAGSLSKGQPVIVHGQQRIKPWNNGEKQGVDVEIEAFTIGHDLRRGTAAFQRASSPLVLASRTPVAENQALAHAVSASEEEPQRMAG